MTERRHCLSCKNKDAVLPKADPIFCSEECVGRFMIDRYFWCTEHQEWFDPNFGCKGCNKQQKIAKLKSRRVALDKQIADLKTSS